MSKGKESPEDRRERLRQRELNTPSSSVHGSNLSDLVGGFGWKGAGILILVLILGFIVYAVFFH